MTRYPRVEVRDRNPQNFISSEVDDKHVFMLNNFIVQAFVDINAHMGNRAQIIICCLEGTNTRPIKLVLKITSKYQLIETWPKKYSKTLAKRYSIGMV